MLFLGLPSKTVTQQPQKISQAQPLWQELIERSFLSRPLKEQEAAILKERIERLNL